MTIKQVILTTLVFLVPLVTILGAVYEIATGKKGPELYFLLVAIPGGLMAGLRELKEFLPPDRLIFQIDKGKVCIRHTHFSRGGALDEETGLHSKGELYPYSAISFPIRISNRDREKSIDILDVRITSLDDDVDLTIPNGWFRIPSQDRPELFNDGKTKTIEPMKIKDYDVSLNKNGEHLIQYNLRLTFCDNFGRKYSSDIQLRKGS